MSTEGKQIAPMETFLERVKSKLRDDIGSLLPDEVVSDMVKRVVNEEFFESKKVRIGGPDYSPVYETREPEFKKMVIDAIKPILKEKVAEFLLQNSEKIEAQLDELIKRQAGMLMIDTINSLIGSALSNQRWSIENSIRSAIDRRS